MDEALAVVDVSMSAVQSVTPQEGLRTPCQAHHRAVHGTTPRTWLRCIQFYGRRWCFKFLVFMERLLAAVCYHSTRGLLKFYVGQCPGKWSAHRDSAAMVDTVTYEETQR